MKKVFSFFAIGTFMIGGLEASNLEVKSCMEIAVTLHNDLQEAGVSHAEAYRISGEALNACEEAESQN